MNILLIIFILFILSTMIYFVANANSPNTATSNIATRKLTDNEYQLVLGGGGYGYCDSKNIISTTKGTKYDDCSKLCDSKCNGYDWDSNGLICHTYSDKPVKTVGKPYTASCFSKI